MFSPILFTIFVVSASALDLNPVGYQLDLNPQDQELTDGYYFYQYLHHPNLRRPTRQIHVADYVAKPDEDGSKRNFTFKLPIVRDDKNAFSALGAANKDQDGNLASATGGFAFDNVNGNKFSLTETYIPKFGHQVTAAGQANLIHSSNHNLNANGFITRNLPKKPEIPSYDTFGGGLDYKFKNKVGASIGVTHTPYLQQTDFSARGEVNLFRNNGNSLDFSAGVSRSFFPNTGNSPWNPTGSLTYTKWF